MTYLNPVDDTDTDTVTTDLRLRPNAAIPADRFHPGLFATLEVVSGRLGVQVIGEDAVIGEDDGIDLRADEAPILWNAGPGVTHLRATLRRPAGMREEDPTRLLMAVEALVGLASRQDVLSRQGDDALRADLDRELGDVVDLVHAPAVGPLGTPAPLRFAA
jgi:hypothetical protein